MGYEKNTWSDGDVITAEKLNHLEDGVSESGADDTIVYVDFVADGNGIISKDSLRYISNYTGRELEAFSKPTGPNFKPKNVVGRINGYSTNSNAGAISLLSVASCPSYGPVGLDGYDLCFIHPHNGNLHVYIVYILNDSAEIDGFEDYTIAWS